jgi:Ca2+-binding EF-hand superfamily protein
LAGLAEFIAKDPGLKKIFDKDGDGKVEANEIREVMEKRFHVKDMSALDRNHDGKIMMDDIRLITGVPNAKPAAPAKGK